MRVRCLHRLRHRFRHPRLLHTNVCRQGGVERVVWGGECACVCGAESTAPATPASSMPMSAGVGSRDGGGGWGGVRADVGSDGGGGASSCTQNDAPLC